MNTNLWRERITLVTGGYGSGKTEVSVGLAHLKRGAEDAQRTVALADMDIVNPYFRSRDQAIQLKEQGIELIAPEGQLRTADLPALPAGIAGAIKNAQVDLVVDVGGDPAGATALGRYSRDLQQSGYEMLMVINPYRPHTATKDEIVDLLRRIESVSRLKITGLVNNGNVMEFTEIKHVVQAHSIVSSVAEATGLPIRFVSCAAALLTEVRKAFDLPVLPLSLVMRPPWVG